MCTVPLCIVDVSNNICYMQELIAKSLESADLNFSRYGDTFFEASYLMLQGFLIFYVKKKLVLQFHCIFIVICEEC